MSPSVSVVVPYFNQAPFVGHALKSVLDQGPDLLEIIVVDDGSTDGGMDGVRALAGSDARVRVERLESNQGAPRARNRGLSTAAGEYVLFLDADDLLHPGALRTLLDGIGDADFAFGDKIDLVERTGEARRISQGPAPTGDPLTALIAKWPVTSTVLFRKSFFARARWDERDACGQEYNMMVSGVLAGARYRHVPSVVATVRQHDSPSRITTRRWGERRRKRVELLRVYEAELRRSGGWTPEREAFFSAQFYHLSYFLFLTGDGGEDFEAARKAWKSVRRSALIRAKSFRWLSWTGVGALFGARAAARLSALVRRR